MSGIAGIVYSDALHTGAQLAPMLRVIKSHTAETSWDKAFSFCHIGCVNGQKGTSLSGFSHCVLDGFFLDRKPIFSLLEEKGIKLSSHISDASLAANLFEFLGPTFLEKIDGEFALCLYDQKKESLLLARDRIGKRNLFWYQDQQNFLFASNIASLLATGLVSPSLSFDSIAGYLFFGYFPQDLSPIKGVSKLLPAHYLHLQLNQSMTIHSYWSYSALFQSAKTYSEEEAKKEIQKSIKKSVQEHQKIAGNTSSALLHSPNGCSQELAEALEKGSYTSLSLLNIEKRPSENLSQILMEAESSVTMDTLEQIVWALDEPIADPNIVRWWFLAKEMVKKDYFVLYSDLGSDELFANNIKYFTPFSLSSPGRFTSFKKKVASLLLPLTKIFWKRKGLLLMKFLRTDPWQLAYLRQNALFSEPLMKKCAPRLGRLFDPQVFLHKFYHLEHVKPRIASYLYLDVKTHLPDSAIPQMRKLLNFHDIALYTPYLSKECVEVSAQIANSLLTAEPDTPFANELWPHCNQEILERELQKIETHQKMVYSQLIFANKHYLIRGILAEIGLVEEKEINRYLSSVKTVEPYWKPFFGLLILEIWMRLLTRGNISLTP